MLCGNCRHFIYERNKTNNGRHVCEEIEIVRVVDMLFFASCFSNVKKSGLKKRFPVSIVSATMTEIQKNAWREQMLMLLMEHFRLIWKTYLEKWDMFWQKRCDCHGLARRLFFPAKVMLFSYWEILILHLDCIRAYMKKICCVNLFLSVLIYPLFSFSMYAWISMSIG